MVLSVSIQKTKTKKDRRLCRTFFSGYKLWLCVYTQGLNWKKKPLYVGENAMGLKILKSHFI